MSPNHVKENDCPGSPWLQINETGIIQRYNESAAATFGFSKEEALGSNINMLMPPEIAERHDGYLQRYKVRKRVPWEAKISMG
jgi:PAS domain S-box-containing protein